VRPATIGTSAFGSIGAPWSSIPGTSWRTASWGWDYRSLGRLEEAEAHIRAALALQSTDVWSYVYLGNTLWAGGREQEAEAAFRQAMAASPGDGLPLWCLAGLVREQGRFGEARRLLRQAFRSNPFDIEGDG
jgi:tetratricopeptide (TPR) repeat protein